MKPTLSGFLIGLILVSMFASIFGLFLSEGAMKYGSSNDTTKLQQFDKLNTLYNQSKKIRDSTSNIEQPTGLLDIVGGFFYNAYLVLATIPASFDIFNSMADNAVDEANLGAGGETIKNAILAIVLILTFIGVILTAIIKSDRL